MATLGAKASAHIVLAWLSRNIPLSAPEGLSFHQIYPNTYAAAGRNYGVIPHFRSEANYGGHASCRRNCWSVLMRRCLKWGRSDLAQWCSSFCGRRKTRVSRLLNSYTLIRIKTKLHMINSGKVVMHGFHVTGENSYCLLKHWKVPAHH